MTANEYDIIIVGAGPAGATAARYAAEAGARVLMLEKDRDVGYPVRCGEAVSHEGVIQFLEPDPRWIASTITKFRIVMPDGTGMMPILNGTGYVLERRIFDYELARISANAGAEVITKAYVYDLLREEGRITGVKALVKDKETIFRAKVVIAADGVESRVGKWAGIDTTCHIRDMESCAQVTLSGIDVDPDVLEFYLGSDVAPYGYLWVFPKGKDAANVGLGMAVEAAKKKSAVKYLEEFIARRYPNAAHLTRIAGGVPCSVTNKEIVKENVLLVGDAARQVNPLTGGGIITGMIGGMMAGQVAAEAVRTGNMALLPEYHTRWQKRLGWRHEIFYTLRNALNELDDDTYNAIGASTAKLPAEKQTFGAIFRSAVWNKPSLVLDIARLFVS